MGDILLWVSLSIKLHELWWLITHRHLQGVNLRVSFAIASFIWASCSSIEVAPVVMTCMAVLPLESVSENRDLEYFLGLFFLGALSEAKVITCSCLRCSCSSSRVDAGVKAAAKRALALLWVLMPEMSLLAARMFLFFALVAGTA